MEFGGQDWAITLVVQSRAGFTEDKPERLVLTTRTGSRCSEPTPSRGASLSTATTATSRGAIGGGGIGGGS